jgi:hypothetical protein
MFLDKLKISGDWLPVMIMHGPGAEVAQVELLGRRRCRF